MTNFSEKKTPQTTLDLRTTKCPLNFVQTKLALEKLAVGEILEILILIDGESAINIPNSIRQEGHQIVKTTHQADHCQTLWIQKCS